MTLHAPARRLVAESMEPRILHSVDVTPLVGFDRDALHGQSQVADATGTSGRSSEIVFVDAALPDLETLLRDLENQRRAGRPIEVVRIEAGVDGLALIGQTLAGRQDIGAVHVLSHGSDARLQIGSSVLDAETLLQRAGEIAGWADALSADADLLLYGCDLAQGDAGQRLLQDLAALTGADVAASVDPTGAARYGGNWTLEYGTARIEAAVAPSTWAQTQWEGVMATYTVTSTIDIAEVPLVGQLVGSLRWAISQANANPGLDTIVFAINGTFSLAALTTGGDNNLGGDFDITDSVNIIGNGAGNTIITGNGVDRVFDVRNGTVSFSGMTIQSGASNEGAGIRVGHDGVLSVSDAVIRNNVGKGGSQGAGIHTDGVLSLQRVVVQNNGDTTSGDVVGAGIYVTDHATLNALDVEIRDNIASGKDGGGIYIDNNAVVELERVTLAGNRAENGGGIYNAANNTTLLNVTVSGNTAADEGGGIYAERTIALDHVTVAGNAAKAGAGGGVWSQSSSAVSTRNSLFALNTGGNTNRAVESKGYNLSDDNSAGFTGIGDRKNTPSGLGLLADNGGPTRTRAVAIGSAAIDAANPVSSRTADQRGVVHSAGGPDIGAYEWNPDGAAPAISALPDLLVDEDSPLVSVGFTVSDAETPAADLVVTATSNNAGLVPTANIVLSGTGSSRTIGLAPAAQANDNTNGGPAVITLTVSDGTNARSTSFVVSVRAVNDAPVGSVSVSGSAVQGQTLTAGNDLADIDGLGPISYQWRADGAVIAGAVGNTLILREAQVGRAITVSASYRDGSGVNERVDSAATQPVGNVNDAPVFTGALPDQSAPEDAPFSFTVPAGRFSDVDAGDVLTYSAQLGSGSALPAWLGFDPATRRFTGTPSNADVGAFTVRVTATDTAGASASGTFRMTVVNVNDAPVSNGPIANQSASEDVPFSFQVPAGTFDDVDAGDTLRYSARQASGVALPSWLSFDTATQRFSGTPTNANVGSILVRVTAADGSNATASRDFTLAVANTNDAPVLTSALSNQSATEDAPFAYTVPAGRFSDVDAGDVLTFSAQLASGAALPSWLNFDPATRRFTGTPSNADVGAVTVRVTATDGSDASASGNFTLTVANANDAPVLVSPIGNQSATEDAPFGFTLPAGTFADVDAGDTLRYSARLSSGAALPSWLDFHAATQRFSGTPSNADVGSITVRVTATDGSDATASGTFTLTVANVNDAPVVDEPIEGRLAVKGFRFTFVVPADTFRDIDADDSLGYGATLATGGALPSWLSFNASTRTFTGIPGPADVGSLGIRVTATDNSGASAAEDFTIAVVDFNTAPTLSRPLADQVAAEDQAFRFVVPGNSFDDPDFWDQLSYDASLPSGSAWPSWLSFDTRTRTFSGTPGNGDVGSLAIRVTATDGSGERVSDDFVLTVVNVNDAPVLTRPIANQTASEDAPFSYTLPAGAFSDVDAGDALRYSASLGSAAALPGWLRFDAATGTFSGTPGNADVGSITLRVTATDNNDASSSGSFTLTVVNVNDAPFVASPIASQLATEDQPFDFTVPAGTFSDVDAGETLQYSARLGSGEALPTWLRFDPATRTFSGTPANGDVGSIMLRVTATDGAGAPASGDFLLTVANANDAPVLTAPLTRQSATEDSPFGFSIPAGAFSDVDPGDSLRYSAALDTGAPLPAWLSFDPSTQRFSGTPTNADVGGLTLRVTATDGAGARASGDFQLTVANVNDAPVLNGPLADQTAEEDTALAFTLPANAFGDVDVGDTLRYSAQLGSGAALPAWLRFDPATRLFSGTPGNGDVGSLAIRVTATDGSGERVSDDFVLTVVNVNDAPVLTRPIANQTAPEDAPFSYTLPAGAFSDVDAGDALRYSASLGSAAALPSWLRFDAATGTFSGTPGNADVGSITLRVTATDGAGARASGDFQLTVAHVNDAPVLNGPLADQTAEEGTAWAFTLPANAFGEVDVGDTLRYSAQLGSGAALPAWLRFDAATRGFSGTPGNADVGSFTLRVTATDGTGAQTSGDFTLTVVNFNDAPVLTAPIANQSATEDTPFSFTLPAGAFSDVDDGGALRYAAQLASGEALPNWLQFDPATRTFSGTPENADVGVIGLRVTATDDGNASASGAFTLTVLNRNDAPVPNQPLEDRQGTAGNRVQFEVPPASFRDDDAGDTLTYRASLADGSPLPAWLQFDAEARLFTADPSTEHVGTTRVRVLVTDAAGATAEATFVFKVNPGAPLAEEPPAVAAAPAAETVEETAAVVAEAPLPAVPPPDPVTPPIARAPEPVAEATTDTGSATALQRQPSVTEVASTVRLASRSDAVLEAALVPGYENLGASSLGQLLRSDDLMRQLDELQRQMLEPGGERQLTFASGVAVTSGVSIGYIVWLVRGGVLVSSMLSALPVWQMIDPLPVLATAGTRRRQGKHAATEDTDVERLFERSDTSTPPRPTPSPKSAAATPHSGPASGAGSETEPER